MGELRSKVADIDQFPALQAPAGAPARRCAQLQPRRASQSLQVYGNPTYTSIDTSTATVNTESTAGTQSAAAAVLFDGSAPTSDWVTRMSTPNRYRVLSSDDDRAGHDEPFVPVVSRRARRQRQHSSPAAAATNTRVFNHHHRQQLSDKIIDMPQ